MPKASFTARQEYTVKASKGDGIYTVTQAGMIWRCTCRGFEFREHCKHIDALRNKGTAEMLLPASPLLPTAPEDPFAGLV